MNPITDFFTNFLAVFGVNTDNGVANDTAHAIGFDPSTGTFVAQQYADTFAKQNPGVDPAQYVAAAQQKAVDQYNADYAANFQRLGGFSLIPFSPVVGGDKAALDALTPKLPDVCSWIPLLCTDGSDFSGIEEILLIGLLIIGLVLVITVVKAV